MLNRCAECGYSLQGLPKRHCCPECGLPYEGEWIVVEQERAEWVAFAVGSALLVIVGAAVSQWRGVLSPWLVGGAFLLAGAVYRLLQHRTKVLISRNELRIEARDGKQKVFPIGRFKEASWNPLSGEIVIQGERGLIVTIHKGVFRSHRRMRQTVGLINGFLRAATLAEPNICEENRSE